MTCRRCCAEIASGEDYCTNCGAPRDADVAEVSADDHISPYEDPRGMKWYKFLVKGGLFLWAGLWLAEAILRFVGSKDPIYGDYPAFAALEVVLGIILIVYAALAVVTRFFLSGFRRGAHWLLYAVSVGYTVIRVGVVVAVNVIGNSIEPMPPQGIAEAVGGVLLGGLLLTVNLIYFELMRRKDLLVN